MGRIRTTLRAWLAAAASLPAAAAASVVEQNS